MCTHVILTSLLVVVIFVTSSDAQFNCSTSLTTIENVCTCNNASLSIECQYSLFSSVPSAFSTELQLLSIVESRKMVEILDVIPYANLIQLHLNNIGLRYIRSKAFVNLHNLETLTLMNNNITTITNDTFAGLTSLQMLYMEGNRLYEISDYTFTRSVLPSINFLTLASCHIYRINTHAFYDLRLIELNIGYNHLSEFPELDDVTSALRNLTRLDLTGNQLTSLDTASPWIPSSLQELVLNGNHIETVTYSGTVNRTGPKMSKLKHLHLRGNHVSKFDEKALLGFPNLEQIDLVSNQLTSVDAAEWPWKTLDKVLVYDNLWDCAGCVNVWISTRKVVKDWNNDNTTRPSCSTPVQYKDKSVYDVIDSSTCGVKSHAEFIIVMILFILFVFLTLALLIVVVRRRRMKRKMSAINKNGANTNGAVSTTMSYRKMRDMSPFSINDDDDERS